MLRVNLLTLISLSMMLMLPGSQLSACTFAAGHFSQVTSLQGKVVGVNWHSLGPIQYWTWLRHQFSQKNQELRLYQYQGPWSEDAQEIARTKTDSDGRFSFGSVPDGHYSLEVGDGWFDVEITQTVPPTEEVLIDMSPIFPDCTGGHQFWVYSKK